MIVPTLSSRSSLAATLTALALAVAGCSGTADREPPATSAPPQGPSSSTTTPAPVSTTTSAIVEPTPPPPRTDYMTFANGTVLVSHEGLPNDGASRAIQLIDGDSTVQPVSNTQLGEAVIVFGLPAATTFDRFVIPNVVESPGDSTSFRDIEIAGSISGPSDDFEILASVSLRSDGPELVEILPAAVVPIRWIRVRLANGVNVEEGSEERTRLTFTELIGNGEQDAQALSTAFTGTWDLRPVDRLAIPGTPLELDQDGAVVAGCLGTVELRGTVRGSVATAIGLDPATGRSSAYVLVAGETGELHVAAAQEEGRFLARQAVVATTPAPCLDLPSPEPPSCGSVIHVYFDVDSAVIGRQSDRLLSDLYAGLERSDPVGISIVGHTSTEGTATHNQDLSERRAQSVVDALVERGLDPSTISAAGRGESEPLISPDSGEAARSLNRRVEIACQDS